MIPIARPLLGSEEEDAVLRVLASGQLAQGKHVTAFERRFAKVCHVREAVAVSSGTAALHLALLAHDIGPGDEVITTSFSFAATANVILLVSATPVFVDIEPDTYNLDPVLVEAALSPRTKAIMPVHLYVNGANFTSISVTAIDLQVTLANTFGLPIGTHLTIAHAQSSFTRTAFNASLNVNAYGLYVHGPEGELSQQSDRRRYGKNHRQRSHYQRYRVCICYDNSGQRQRGWSVHFRQSSSKHEDQPGWPGLRHRE